MKTRKGDIMKVLNYLFPLDNANHLKIFQGSNSKIRGISFKRNEAVSKYIKTELNDFATNYGIYFLKSEVDEELKLYIGQSTKGYDRIFGHSEKSFWSEGIIFLTENNSWDKTVIDYLEYKLINVFKDSKYTLENVDLRNREPVLDIFQQAKMKDLVEEILFLLASNNIDSSPFNKEDTFIKKYKASKGNKAELSYEDGEFILLRGSELKRPIESSKEWEDKAFYPNKNKAIDLLIESGKANIQNGKIVLVSEVAYKNPSLPAVLTSGYSENGYTYWKGLDEIRNGGY